MSRLESLVPGTQRQEVTSYPLRRRLDEHDACTTAVEEFVNRRQLLLALD
jgi:hypothetical protein